MRATALILLAAVGLSAAACATPMATPGPSIDNLQRLRRAEVPPMALGEFRLAPGLPADMDRRVNVRGSTVTSTAGGSYAQFLKETLAAELKAAGKLDPAAGIVISGQLTESEADAGLDVGIARLGATFAVTRDGREVYRKALRAEERWVSSFYGAVAIPMALNQYTGLYSKLVTKLLEDPEFLAAIQR